MENSGCSTQLVLFYSYNKSRAKTKAKLFYLWEFLHHPFLNLGCFLLHWLGILESDLFLVRGGKSRWNVGIALCQIVVIESRFSPESAVFPQRHWRALNVAPHSVHLQKQSYTSRCNSHWECASRGFPVTYCGIRLQSLRRHQIPTVPVLASRTGQIRWEEPLGVVVFLHGAVY